MNVIEHRQHFVVYVLDSDSGRAGVTVATLRGAGYSVFHYSTSEAALCKVADNPPHILLLQYLPDVAELWNTLASFRERLPESHFFIQAPLESVPNVWREIGTEIYDCIQDPPIHSLQLVKALDRAAERDFFMYRQEQTTTSIENLPEDPAAASVADPMAPVVAANEIASSDEMVFGEAQAPMVDVGALAATPQPMKIQTHTAAAEAPASTLEALARQEMIDDTGLFAKSILESLGEGVTETHIEIPMAARERPGALGGQFELWVQEMLATESVDSVLQVLFDGLVQRLGRSRILYLRYLGSRRHLAVTLAHQVADEAWQGVGINLQTDSEFRLADLRRPALIHGLAELLKEVFACSEFLPIPFLVRGEVHGVLVVLEAASALPQGDLTRLIEVAQRQASYLDMERYLHTVDQQDAGGPLLNRHAFLARLNQEIARARRISQPVSLVVFALDQYRDIIAKQGLDEANMAMRTIAKILQPRCRVNDLLGRMGPEEVGLILPHTTKEGAMIKAERIRRLLEAADFSRLLRLFPQLTITAGVSEYPSCSRDADELFATADNALWQVKGAMPNRVCAAEPVEGYRRDFTVASSVTPLST